LPRATRSKKDQMLMNWPERVWIYSPVRVMFLRLHAERWLKLAGVDQAQHVLEIGCGLGRGARILVDKMGFKNVVAFDLEESLIRGAVKKLPPRLESKISFFVGDAQSLPFGDSVFDAVVNFGIIHHVLDWRKCIREIGRVMRHGGIFYFEEIYPPLYANFLLKRMLRHPREDRFDGPLFLESLDSSKLRLLDGVRTDSRFGIIGAARKE
jgi:ubiquinone/menaquinone biosynthesis C-methylase UbiE